MQVTVAIKFIGCKYVENVKIQALQQMHVDASINVNWKMKLHLISKFIFIVQIYQQPVSDRDTPVMV